MSSTAKSVKGLPAPRLILCRQCGWRWLEDQQWRELGLAEATGTESTLPQTAPPRRSSSS